LIVKLFLQQVFFEKTYIDPVVSKLNTTSALRGPLSADLAVGKAFPDDLVGFGEV
jgi:hypothetical protein